MHMLRRFAVAVTILAAGCGKIPAPMGGDDGGMNHIDAPPGQADAPTSGAATVITISEGAPVGGVDVLFEDETGAVQQHLVSDANGMATYDVHAGWMVTALTHDASTASYTISTVTGVNPGDTITIGTHQPQFKSDSITNINVTFPTGFAGATSYDVRFGSHCNQGFTDGPGTISVTLDSGCVDFVTSKIYVLAKAYDSMGNPVAYATTNAMYLGPMIPTAVTLPPWRTDWQLSRWPYSHPPSSALSIQLSQTEFANSMIKFDLDGSGADVVANPNGQLNLLTPRMLGTDVFVQSSLFYGDATMTTAFAIAAHRFPVAMLPSTFPPHDLTNTFYPRLDQVKYERMDARPQIAWAEPDGSVSSAGAVGAVAVAGWTHNGANYQWLLSFPADQADKLVTYPEIPAELMDYIPGQVGDPFSTPALAMVEIDVAPDYDTFKSHLNSSLFIDNDIPVGVVDLKAVISGFH